MSSHRPGDLEGRTQFEEKGRSSDNCGVVIVGKGKVVGEGEGGGGRGRWWGKGEEGEVGKGEVGKVGKGEVGKVGKGEVGEGNWIRIAHNSCDVQYTRI